VIGFKPVVVHLWIENWMAFLWVRREGGVITSVENSNEKKPLLKAKHYMIELMREI